MNALELRYKLRSGLSALLKDPQSGYVGAELLSPGTDGAVRMRVVTTDPMGAERTYTVTIKED